MAKDKGCLYSKGAITRLKVVVQVGTTEPGGKNGDLHVMGGRRRERAAGLTKVAWAV